MPENLAPRADLAESDAGAAARQAVMAALADATPAELEAGLAALGGIPSHREIRPPEIGLVMVRGRIGGDGAPFNLGEATVTRAAVVLASGTQGFAYLAGRRPREARLAALIEALAQERPAEVEAALVAPVRARVAAGRELAAKRTAATRVEFFTMVRGED